MANYRFKNKVTDDLEDASDIVKQLHRMIKESKADKESVLINLATAIKKLESAKYYVDRE